MRGEAVGVVNEGVGVNVCMYVCVYKGKVCVWGAVGWRRILAPCASCQIDRGSTCGSDLTSA